MNDGKRTEHPCGCVTVRSKNYDGYIRGCPVASQLWDQLGEALRQRRRLKLHSAYVAYRVHGNLPVIRQIGDWACDD